MLSFVYASVKPRRKQEQHLGYASISSFPYSRDSRRSNSCSIAASAGVCRERRAPMCVSKFHSNGYRGTLSVNSAEILGPLKYELRNMSYELWSRKL